VAQTLQRLAPLLSVDALAVLKEASTPYTCAASALQSVLSTCFTEAVRCGHDAVLQAFMDSGMHPAAVAHRALNEEWECWEHPMETAAEHGHVPCMQWLHSAHPTHPMPSTVYRDALCGAIKWHAAGAVQYLLTLKVVQRHLHAWPEPFCAAFNMRMCRDDAGEMDQGRHARAAVLAVKALCTACTATPLDWAVILGNCVRYAGRRDHCPLHYMVRAALHQGAHPLPVQALLRIMVTAVRDGAPAMVLTIVGNTAAAAALQQGPGSLWSKCLQRADFITGPAAQMAQTALTCAPVLCAHDMQRGDLFAACTQQWDSNTLPDFVRRVTAPGVLPLEALLRVAKALAHLSARRGWQHCMQYVHQVWAACCARGDFTLHAAADFADHALCGALGCTHLGDTLFTVHRDFQHKYSYQFTGCAEPLRVHGRLPAIVAVLSLRHPVGTPHTCVSAATVRHLAAAAVMGELLGEVEGLLAALEEHAGYTAGALEVHTMLSFPESRQAHPALLPAALRGMSAAQLRDLLHVECAEGEDLPQGPPPPQGARPSNRNTKRMRLCSALLKNDAFVMDAALICKCRAADKNLYDAACAVWFNKRRRQTLLHSRLRRRAAQGRSTVSCANAV